MILVTGCGPLGQALFNALSTEMVKGICELTNLEIPRGYLTYDVEKPGEITKLVEEERPDLVVLTEEINNVEYCEKNRVDAMHYNTRSTRYFTEAAIKAGARIVYISSASVFDGRKPGGLYLEEDRVNPLNVYAETKLMGEVATDKASNFLIIRPGEIYGDFPDNIASYILSNLKAGEKVELATDMYFSPIYLDDAVKAIKMLTVNNIEGIFNIAGPERISHYEFGRRIASVFSCSEDLIVPVGSDSLGMTVLLPKDTSLDTGKLAPLIKISGLEEGLGAMKAAIAVK